MTAVFISDLHLDDSRPAATKYFLKLLDELKLNKIDKLYILGDFLEYWVGDDDPSSCARECFEALKNAYDLSTTKMKNKMEELTGGLNLNLPGLNDSK